MKNMTPRFFRFSIFGSVVVIVLATVTLRQVQGDILESELTIATPIVSVTHVSTMLSPEFFDEAYAKAPAREAIQTDTRGMIVPHHLLPAPLIAAFFESARHLNPSRVVIVGPDHLSRARAGAIVSRARWKTPYGFIEPDLALIDALGLPVEEGVFDVEHSIAALVPFIKKSFPNAMMVPILVNGRLTEEQIGNLKASATFDDALVIASVDFSHYLPARVAEFHDRTSRAALSDVGATFRSPDELEIDSQESLDIFMGVMDRLGARRMHLFENTNSARVSQSMDLQETTSYVMTSFSEGPSEPDSTVTMLFVGDMMFDRNVAKTSAGRLDYPFDKIRGAEDRFFRGVDFVVGNLEGAISRRRAPDKENDFAFPDGIASVLKKFNFDVVNLANNHTLDQGRVGVEDTKKALAAAGIGFFGDQVKDDTPAARLSNVAFLGFNATDNPVDEKQAELAVRSAAAPNNLVVVNVHWGAEYQPRPTEGQRAFGRKLVEWGADAVIGHHPHWMQGMEVWQGKPIFWSLGNFIFDQYWSEETQKGLAVGIAFPSTIYLFPIISEASQPRLAAGPEDRALLQTFADRSDLPPALREQALRGIISL